MTRLSVIKSKRQEGKLQVLTKARELCAYTVMVCKNEKNFPKRDRWIITQPIVSEALNMNRKSISKERRKLRKLHKLMDERRISGDDIRANYDSWKANAKRGNTRGIILSMDRYYANLFGEETKHGKSAC